MDARRILLEGLIDHAPMFPPARLPLEEALADHRRARASDESWLLARFVAPAAVVDELPPDLPVSAVADAPVDGVEAVEVRVETAEQIRAFPDTDAETYFELPRLAGCRLLVEAIHGRGAHAKVRCGGERVPTAPELAEFIRTCRELDVPFKATAGLHQPLRHDGEHGFLNLLAAAASDDVERMLASDDPDELLGAAPRAARAALRSIGSCSFWEPVEGLKTLGALPL